MRPRPPGKPFGIVAGTGRERGTVISLVEEGSPAGNPGLKTGDLILAASGSPVSGASEVARALDTADERVSLDVLRWARRLIVAPDATGSTIALRRGAIACTTASRDRRKCGVSSIMVIAAA